MARKKKNRDAGKGAYWMDTYGDMVTLLLTFFVLLFSFSTINEQKWKKLVAAFSGKYGDNPSDVGEPPDDISPSGITFETTSAPESTPTPTAGHTQKPDDLDPLYLGIKEFIYNSGLSAQVELSRTDIEIIIRFRDSIMFDSGKADIKNESKVVLDNIANVLLTYQNEIQMVRIEGHTDNVPIHTSKFPSNWELSTTRAVEVVKYLIEQKKFDSRKLSPSGYGEQHPIASNTTDEGRARNRRVDFVITRMAEIK